MNTMQPQLIMPQGGATKTTNIAKHEEEAR